MLWEMFQWSVPLKMKKMYCQSKCLANRQIICMIIIGYVPQNRVTFRKLHRICDTCIVSVLDTFRCGMLDLQNTCEIDRYIRFISLDIFQGNHYNIPICSKQDIQQYTTHDRYGLWLIFYPVIVKWNRKWPNIGNKIANCWWSPEQNPIISN